MLLKLTGTPTLEPAVPLSPDPAPIRKYDVVAEYPHDPQALTQGLIYTGGFLYESIGGQRQSSIRKVELETGRVIKQHAVDSRYVGEEDCVWSPSGTAIAYRKDLPENPEASGGITLETIRAKAESGVDLISTGRITQSAPAVDIGLDEATG